MFTELERSSCPSFGSVNGRGLPDTKLRTLGASRKINVLPSPVKYSWCISILKFENSSAHASAGLFVWMVQLRERETYDTLACCSFATMHRFEPERVLHILFCFYASFLRQRNHIWRRCVMHK